MPVARMSIAFADMNGLVKPFTWFIRKHPAVILTLCSIYVYLLSVMFLNGYLQALGADPAWFDVSLMRLVALAWPGMMVGVLLVCMLIAMVWAVTARSSAESARVLVVCSFFVGIVSTLWFATYIPRGVRDLTALMTVLTGVMPGILCFGFFWLLRYASRDTTKLRLARMRLEARIERLTSTRLRNIRQSDLLEKSAEKLRSLPIFIRRTSSPWAGAFGIFSIVIIGIPCVASFYSGIFVAQMRLHTPWSGLPVSSGGSTILFTDGSASIRVSRFGFGKALQFYPSNGSEPVDLIVGDVAEITRELIQKEYEMYMRRFREIHNTPELPSIIGTRIRMLNIRFEIIKEMRMSGEVPRNVLGKNIFDAMDVWGRKFVYSGLTQGCDDIQVRSAGGDGIYNTDDDLIEGDWNP